MNKKEKQELKEEIDEIERTKIEFFSLF